MNTLQCPTRCLLYDSSPTRCQEDCGAKALGQESPTVPIAPSITLVTSQFLSAILKDYMHRNLSNSQFPRTFLCVTDQQRTHSGARLCKARLRVLVVIYWGIVHQDVCGIDNLMKAIR